MSISPFHLILDPTLSYFYFFFLFLRYYNLIDPLYCQLEKKKNIYNYLSAILLLKKKELSTVNELDLFKQIKKKRQKKKKKK
jgi:hypothetical protein